MRGRRLSNPSDVGGGLRPVAPAPDAALGQRWDTGAMPRSAAFRTALAALAIACQVPVAASEAYWLDIVPPGVPPHTRVEVDAASLRSGLLGAEATVRVLRAPPTVHRAGFTYESFVAVVRFDCAAQALEPIAVSYYGGPGAEGPAVAHETDLSVAGIAPGVLSVIDPAIERSLLRAACAVA